MDNTRSSPARTQPRSTLAHRNAGLKRIPIPQQQETCVYKSAFAKHADRKIDEHAAAGFLSDSIRRGAVAARWERRAPSVVGCPPGLFALQPISRPPWREADARDGGRNVL